MRSDHLPLKKFLHKNTLNTKVNNWAVEISPYRIHFEYIKGIKNTLADTMSRLIQIDPEAKLNPEPEGYEFGYHAFEDMEPIKSDIQEIKVSTEREPITLPQEEIKLPLSDEKLLALQAKDKFCNDISNKLQQGQLQDKNPYYKENEVLKRYVEDGKQRFEVVVTDIKKVIPADHISAQLPDYNKLGRLTKLRLNPRSIPNLDWQLASELHPSLALYKTAKITDQITATTQATSIITAEIVTKSTKLKQDLNPSFIHNSYKATLIKGVF